MDTSPCIVVIGATGFTGSLIARRLAAGAVPFVLAGRSAERLGRLAASLGGASTRVLDVRDIASVQKALRPGDAVINCAGPFTDLGDEVVEASTRAGAHYLDTTGEQLFMRRTWERYRRTAHDGGVALVNAMAFEYAIGDCAAAAAAAGLRKPLRSMTMVYRWEGGVAVSSRGTRRSVLRVVRDGGVVYRGGEWRNQGTAAERRQVRLPDGRVRSAISFPAGEILTVPRHTPVREVTAWMVLGRWRTALVPVAAPALPLLTRLATPFIELLLRRAPVGPSEEQRAGSGFQILAAAIGADGESRSVAVTGKDPYGITAALAVAGAHRVLQAPRSVRGVLTPAQLLPPDAARPLFAEHGLTWHTGSAPA